MELYYDSQWTTVCDVGWDLDDAEVACKMAGFLGAVSYTNNAAFGEGSGNILLSNVDCTGTEDSLLDCAHSGLYSHTCFHSSDAGVVCRESGELNFEPEIMKGYLAVYFTLNHTAFKFTA